MLNWEYKDGTLSEVPDNAYGFIYLIEYEDDNGNVYTYYGKKQFYSYISFEPLKNGSKRDNHFKFKSKNIKGKRVTKEIVRKESNWKTYNGSLKTDIANLRIINKEILRICDSAIDLTYWEEFYLHINEVLFDKYNLNMNIAGKYFAGKLTGSKEYK